MLRGFPGGTTGKEPACQCRRHKRHGFDPWVRKIPWRREWQPTPVFLYGEFHGQRSLVGYSSWGSKESDSTEQLTFNISMLKLRIWRMRFKKCTASLKSHTQRMGEPSSFSSTLLLLSPFLSSSLLF